MSRILLHCSWVLKALWRPVVASGNNSTTNVTDSLPAAESTSVLVIEIVVIGFSVVLLIIFALKMSTLVRPRGPSSIPNNSMYYSIFLRHLHLDTETVECAMCSARQDVPNNANVFVCCSCHSANFIQRENGRMVRNFSPSPSPSGKRVSLQRVTDTFFRVQNEDEPSQNEAPAQEYAGASDASPTNGEPTSHINSPAGALDVPVDGADGSVCNVCMDSRADTVMMPCAHGGICYNCADALIRKYLL